MISFLEVFGENSIRPKTVIVLMSVPCVFAVLRHGCKVEKWNVKFFRVNWMTRRSAYYWYSTCRATHHWSISLYLSTYFRRYNKWFSTLRKFFIFHVQLITILFCEFHSHFDLVNNLKYEKTLSRKFNKHNDLPREFKNSFFTGWDYYKTE